ncbi:MAG: hypothetical protein HFI13_13745 [Lachnospiraceae bacterium]|jgi:Bacterial transcriptional activator domain.|nr:hypothetical protein [Lachnospiraceae bacterium]
MKTGLREDALYVQTFGGFSLSYKGKVITGSMKSKESQFIYLMQILLHERAEGVSRDRLEEVLFAERDVGDIRHAMRSIIYNAKKKLRAAGMPNVNYIVRRDGTYYWTDEVPVVEDAWEFEQAYQKAEKEQNQKDQTGLYLDACYHYTGEFLPAHAGVLWVAQEARRYHSLFCTCVNRAVRLLRAGQHFQQMEELGLYAAKICPLSDWETVTMEALVSMGRHEDARRFYDDTVDIYFREQGLKPSPQMMKLFHRLGTQIEHRHGALDEIQLKLTDESNDAPGGYLCPYPVFQGIYRMVERMMERSGQSIYLMMCMVVDKSGQTIRDREILEGLTERLEDAVLCSLRRSDAVSRYGSGQYLVLLVNTALESCSIIQDRINERFLSGWQQTGVQYYVNSVICSPDQKSTLKSKEG